MSPRTFVTRGAALLALASIGLAACESKTVITPQPVPLTVTVSPSAVTLTAVGQKATFVALVSGGETGQAAQGVTWSSSNSAVATVDATGSVTAVANGTATIIATSKADATKQSAGVVTVNTGGQTQTGNPVISISNITTNTGGPVDVNNVQGQINVYLTADIPTGATVSKMEVYLNGVAVCSQTLGTGTSAPGEVTTAGVQAQLTFICPIDTRAFNATTGAPKFPNGPYTLSAKLLGTTPGGSTLTPLAETNQMLNFNNVNFLALSVSGSKTGTNPTTGVFWQGGDVTIKVTPVLYSPATFTGYLFSTGVGLPLDTTVVVSAAGPYTLVIPQARFAGNGPQGQVAFTATGLINVPGTQPFSDTVKINLDERAPAYSLNYATTSTNSAFTFTSGWLNATTLLAPSSAATGFDILGLTDLADCTIPANALTCGVNTNTATVTTNTAGAGYVAATTVAALGNQAPGAVLVRVTVCDAFQNCRTYTSNALGVDLIVPALVYDTTVTPANLSAFTTCGTTGAVSVAAVDTGSTVPGAVSGLAGNFMTYTVSKNGATATNTASALTTFAIDTVQAYYAITPKVTDVAGNSFSLPTMLYLVDCVAPVVGPIGVTPIPLVSGGTYTVSASVTDNVDLDSNRLLQHFASGDAFEVASNTLGDFGPPLLTASNATFTVTPFIASIQMVASLGTAGVGSLADALAVQQWDQAGLEGHNSISIGAFVTPPAAFDFGSGAHAVSAFTLTAANGTLSAAATTGFGVTPPFSYLLFFVQVVDPNAGPVWVPIPGAVTTGFIEQGTGNRTTTYSKTTTLATGTYAVLAIDANGNALMTTTAYVAPPAP